MVKVREFMYHAKATKQHGKQRRCARFSTSQKFQQT